MDVYTKAPKGGLNGSDDIGCAHEQGKWPGLHPVTAEVRAPSTLACAECRSSCVVGPQVDLWLCGPAKPDGKGTHGSCTDDSPCLWNVVTDPQERHEVAASNPAVVASMKARLAELRKGFAPDADFNQTGDFCAAAKANNGFCSPWVQTKTDDTTCTSDEDCQLNGICRGGACHCNPGWTGAACALLDRRPPASKAAAAVYGMHPNVTSWGGNALLDNKTGLHHLFVTEIAGPNGTSCGLISWGSHSTIIHAVSTQGIEGPYEKKAVAVGHGMSIACQTHDG